MSERVAPAETDSASSRRWPERGAALDAVLMFGGIVVFLVMLYEMRVPPRPGKFLNPPLMAAAGVILLWPLRHLSAVRAIFLAGGFLFLLWLLQKLSGVLLPFAFVYLLAYLFEPGVQTLQERYGVPRWLSSLGVTALIVGALTLMLLRVVPALLGEAQSLGFRIIESMEGLRQWVTTTPLLDRVAQTGLVDKNEFVNQVEQSLRGLIGGLTANIPAAAQQVASSVGTVFGIITMTAILPVALYYLLKDFPFINRRLIELFPTFGGQRDYLIKAGGIVGNYLRGQLLISLIAAVNVSFWLSIFGFPFAILLGIVGGLLNMIPNLGALITMVLGILIALVFGDPLLKDLVVVTVVFMAQQLLESSLLSPMILSQQVGLHPVLVLLSLFVFGFFMGTFGLFVAVPITAITMTFYKAYRHQITLDFGKKETATSTAAVPMFVTTSTKSITDVQPVRSQEGASPEEHADVANDALEEEALEGKPSTRGGPARKEPEPDA